jgi:hypothetical protein
VCTPLFGFLIGVSRTKKSIKSELLYGSGIHEEMESEDKITIHVMYNEC